MNWAFLNFRWRQQTAYYLNDEHPHFYENIKIHVTPFEFTEMNYSLVFTDAISTALDDINE